MKSKDGMQFDKAYCICFDVVIINLLFIFGARRTFLFFCEVCCGVASVIFFLRFPLIHH